MKTNGVIYVATRHAFYLEAATASAQSLKTLCPEISVTLFTNLPSSSNTYKWFNSVIPIESVTGYHSPLVKMTDWGEGLLDKVTCLKQSPYDNTLYLDADTKVVSADIRDLFSILDVHEIAMVECQPDASFSRKHLGLRMFNAGVILYKNSEKTTALFKEWGSLFEQQLEAVIQNRMQEQAVLLGITDPRKQTNLLCNDQVSLVRLLSPEVNKYDLKVTILNEGWNYRGSTDGRELAYDLKIVHRDYLKDQAKYRCGRLRFIIRWLLDRIAIFLKLS